MPDLRSALDIVKSEDQPYLQVRNERGELLGLMKGPFPASVLRRRVISFVVEDHIGVYVGIRLGMLPPKPIEIVHLDVVAWGYREKTGWREEKLFYALRVTPEQERVLPQISAFR